MVSVDESKIAKLKTHGQNFEILIDTNKALAFKQGAQIDVRDILAIPTVFSDAKKGEEASANAMRSIFKTEDPLDVAKIIIQKGEIPLTTEYKNRLRETKKKQIINLIHRNAVDPKTHLPHPPARIEAAMEEAKVRVDEFTDTNKQMQEALKKIRPIIPIKFEVKEIAFKIPAACAGKANPIVKSFGKLLRDEWQRDGSWVAVIELPGGLEEDFYGKLNALCHGEVETKVLKIK
ncbi:ribosome assembly factor SBDS [Candidatus Woesearchaeota archaeon]|nr:ribosome assembly factor SBDS [Candidatus Woesearchaeota archaeon]